MDLLNDELRSVLDKFGYLGVNLEGGVEIDGRYLGPKAPITSKDLHIIVDAVNRGRQLLQNNSMRLTIHEFSSTFPNPDDAYKFMAALTLLKNKSGTGIYYVAPFGNFTSLHYQGLIVNAVIPEDAKPAKAAKVEAPKKEDKQITVTPNADKSAKVEITGPVEVKEGAKVEIKAKKEDKPKTPRKSAKSETKTPAKRTTPKKRK